MPATGSRRRCDNEGRFRLHGSQVLDAAGVDVYVFGRLKTEREVATLRHSLVIDQVGDADVVGSYVAAACSTTKTEGSIEVVVHTAQSPNRCRRIDDHTTGVDRHCVAFDHIVVVAED